MCLHINVSVGDIDIHELGDDFILLAENIINCQEYYINGIMQWGIYYENEFKLI